MSLNHHHPAYATTIDAAFRAKPQPAEGSMDATAWGEWASPYGEGSPQHRKAVQEVTRIRQSRLITPQEIYRPMPPYFPTPVHHIPRHQGFGRGPWAY